MSQAVELVDRAWAAGWEPDAEIDVDEWADAHRILTSKSAHVTGPWDTGLVPFAREWMKNISPRSPVQRMALMTSRQMAKTDGVGLNWIGYTLACGSGPMYCVQPSIDLAKLFRKQRITPMIDACQVLRERLGAARGRDSENTLLLLGFPGGVLRLGGANSSASLRMTARNIFGDEIDEWPEDVDEHGDPLAILEAGAANFPNRKIALAGNPGVKDRSRTEKEYLKGDQRRYVVRCPLCDHADYLTWQGVDWFGANKGTHHFITWEKPVPAGEMPVAWMVCGQCGGRVDEFHKEAMLAGGEWVPMAVGDGLTRSYQISSLYSPPGFRTWSECVHEFLGAKDNPNLLRSFVNNVLGEPFEDRSEKVQVSDLLDKKRHEDYGAEVPDGVGVLVAGTDTQADRLIHLVLGFGAGEECWIIDWLEIAGDPRKPEVWFELDEAYARTFKHVSGREMRPKRNAIDSGGKAGVTDHVYRYCATRAGRGVFAVKGDVTRGKPLLGVPSRRNRYRTDLFLLCVDTGKSDIYARLQQRAPGPGYFHFPEDMNPEFFKQLTSEKALYKSKGREWIQTYPRNHVLDATVYGLAALRMLGSKFIRDLGARAEWLRKPPANAPPPPPPPEEGDTETMPPAPIAPPPTPLQQRDSWLRRGLPPGRNPWRR